MNKLIKYFKRVDGQLPVEFAVTTAMMATLVGPLQHQNFLVLVREQKRKKTHLILIK